MAEERVQRRLVAILAADVVGYSHLIEADEEGTRARFRSLYSELIDPKIAADDGRIVKTTGDGVLSNFRARSMPFEARWIFRKPFGSAMPICRKTIASRSAWGSISAISL